MTDGPTREPLQATVLLRRAVGGDQASADALFEAVHAELHGLAERVMRSERADHTLQPTALVNEAFLRLVGMEQVDVRGRDQFLALAARAMRRVLVDHARSRSREKRGGGRRRVALDGEAELGGPGASGDDGGGVDDVDRALERLAERSPRQAKVVELRFFGGLSNATIARILEVSEKTVHNDWRAARAWLSVELRKP